MSKSTHQSTSAILKQSSHSHLTSVDLMRFIAAACVIYLHTVSGYALEYTGGFTRFAVPFFSASATYFAVFSACSTKRTPLTTYARSRVVRIYVPFALWSLIYFASRAVASCFLNTNSPSIGIEVLYTGPSHHLWFLPYIVTATLAAFILARVMHSLGSLDVAGIVMFMVGGIATLTEPDINSVLGYTASLSYKTLASACWGFALAAVVQSGRFVCGGPQVRSAVAVAGFLSLIILAHFDSTSLLYPNLCGWFALAMALAVPLKPSKAIILLGSYAYGIYLTHILYVEGLQDLVAALQIDPVSWMSLIVFILSILLSTLTCYLISLLPCSDMLGVPRRKKSTPAKPSAYNDASGR